MTLKECIEKYGMGNGQKFYEENHTVQDQNFSFEPKFVHYYKGANRAAGLLNTGMLYEFCIEETDPPNDNRWHFYSKEKVVRWLWAALDTRYNPHFGVTKFFSEVEAELYKKKHYPVKYVKLEWSRTEFEE